MSEDEFIERLEPCVHMYPDDLLRFKESEAFAQAFSVAVGRHGETTVPLYPIEDVVRAFRAGAQTL